MASSKKPTSLVLVSISDMNNLNKTVFIFLSFSLLPAQSAYNLYSPYMELPSIGADETMHFGFYLYCKKITIPNVSEV